MPSVTIRWAGATSIRWPRNTIVPRVGRFRPEIVFSVVVFPAPLPPMSVTISPSSTRQRDALDGLDAAVVDVHTGELKDRHRHSPPS